MKKKDITLSCLQNKTVDEIKKIKNRYYNKIQRLRRIVSDMKDFGIELSSEQLNEIQNFEYHYTSQIYKIASYLRNIKQ